MAQVLGCLPPMWITWIEFLIPGSDLVLPTILSIGESTNRWNVSPSLLLKWIKMKITFIAGKG